MELLEIKNTVSEMTSMLNKINSRLERPKQET